MLEQDLVEEIFVEFKKEFPIHVSSIWEELSRISVHNLKIGNIKWKPANRWWGRGTNGQAMEIDIISESFDKKYILFGEAKWDKAKNLNHVIEKLYYCAKYFPHLKKKKPIFAYWLKQHGKSTPSNLNIIQPQDIL